MAALEWRHAFDEHERNADAGYFAHRALSVRGRTLGGLLWLRGDGHHHGAALREIAWRSASVYVRRNGEWKDATAYRRVDGEWVEASMYVAGGRWPPHACSSGKADKYSRDQWYVAQVEGRDLLGPIEGARAYLVAER